MRFVSTGSVEAGTMLSPPRNSDELYAERVISAAARGIPVPYYEKRKEQRADCPNEPEPLKAKDNADEHERDENEQANGQNQSQD